MRLALITNESLYPDRNGRTHGKAYLGRKMAFYGWHGEGCGRWSVVGGGLACCMHACIYGTDDVLFLFVFGVNGTVWYGKLDWLIVVDSRRWLMEG